MIKFLKQFENIFENKLIALAGLLGMFLGPVADALGSAFAYWSLVGVLVLLMLYAFYDEAKRYNRLHQEVIHLPIVIRVDDKTEGKYTLSLLLDAIEKETSITNYKEQLLKYRGINVEEFVFEYSGTLYDFDRLLSFARIISYNINQVEKEIGAKIRFHVAYYRRPSVAFMLGVIFRTEGIVLYQNNDAGETFERVSVVDSRRYKEKVKTFQRYDVTRQIKDANSDEALVIINSASHDIDPKTPSLQRFANKIILSLKGNGTIPYTEDWTLYSQEIYTVLHDARMEFKKLHIVHAMPEAIAFLVGMAIENYWDIEITQYDSGEYRHMYNMQEAKFYF